MIATVRTSIANTMDDIGHEIGPAIREEIDADTELALLLQFQEYRSCEKRKKILKEKEERQLRRTLLLNEQEQLIQQHTIRRSLCLPQDTNDLVDGQFRTSTEIQRRHSYDCNELRETENGIHLQNMDLTTSEPQQSQHFLCRNEEEHNVASPDIALCRHNSEPQFTNWNYEAYLQEPKPRRRLSAPHSTIVQNVLDRTDDFFQTELIGSEQNEENVAHSINRIVEVDDAMIAAQLQSEWDAQEEREKETQCLMDMKKALELQLLDEGESKIAAEDTINADVQDGKGNGNSTKNHDHDSDLRYLTDKVKALELQLEEENTERRRLKEEIQFRDMKTTTCGKAVVLAKLVIEEIRSCNARTARQSKPSEPPLIEPFAIDDMVAFTERFIETYEQFKERGYTSRELYVDIGFHYTSSKDLTLIRTVGLLTASDRSTYQIDPENVRGAVFGDGIYTCNNPFTFLKYGDTGLMVARLLGKTRLLDCYPEPRATAATQPAAYTGSSKGGMAQFHSAILKMSQRARKNRTSNVAVGVVPAVVSETYDSIRGNKFRNCTPISQRKSLPALPPIRPQAPPKRTIFPSLSTRARKSVVAPCDANANSVGGVAINMAASSVAQANSVATTGVSPCAGSGTGTGESDTTPIPPPLPPPPMDYEFFNEDVLQTSSQCLPLVRYDTSIVGTEDTSYGHLEYSNNMKTTAILKGKHSATILKLKERLQKVLDEFFDQSP